MQEKTSGTQGNHGGPIVLSPPPPIPQQQHHHPSEDSTLGDAYLKQYGTEAKTFLRDTC